MRARVGFTIMEAVAAVVVLGVAMPPMLWALRQANQHRTSQILTSRARWIAAEALENALADRHSPARGYAHVTTESYPAEASVAGFPQFSRSVVVVETGPDLVTEGSGYKRVTCTVGWNDSAGAPRALVLETVVTDYLP